MKGYRSNGPHKGLELASNWNVFVSTTVSFYTHQGLTCTVTIFRLGTSNHRIIEHISSIWLIHTFRPPVFPQWLTLSALLSLYGSHFNFIISLIPNLFSLSYRRRTIVSVETKPSVFGVLGQFISRLSGKTNSRLINWLLPAPTTIIRLYLVHSRVKNNVPPSSHIIIQDQINTRGHASMTTSQLICEGNNFTQTFCT